MARVEAYLGVYVDVRHFGKFGQEGASRSLRQSAHAVAEQNRMTQSC